MPLLQNVPQTLAGFASRGSELYGRYEFGPLEGRALCSLSEPLARRAPSSLAPNVCDTIHISDTATRRMPLFSGRGSQYLVPLCKLQYQPSARSPDHSAPVLALTMANPHGDQERIRLLCVYTNDAEATA